MYVVVNHAVYKQDNIYVYANTTNHLQIFMFFFSLVAFYKYRDDLEFQDQRAISDRRAKRVKLRLWKG